MLHKVKRSMHQSLPHHQGSAEEHFYLNPNCLNGVTDFSLGELVGENTNGLWFSFLSMGAISLFILTISMMGFIGMISHVVEGTESELGFILEVSFYSVSLLSISVLPIAFFFSLYRPQTLLAYLAAIHTYQRLKASGRLIDGTLTNIIVKRDGKRHVVEAEYQFIDPVTQQTITGIRCRSTNEFHMLPEVGVPVHILYADENAHFML